MRTDLSEPRRVQAEQRRLPLEGHGYIRQRLPGDVCLVVFEQGRKAFVRAEDLQLLVERQSLQSERARMAESLELQKRAESVLGYFTPETVDQANAFGRRSAFHGHRLMKRWQFLSTATEHPHPESLWRAYVYGHRVGKRQREQRIPTEREGNDETGGST